MSHSQTDTPKADIMIVDDTRANLRLLSQILAEQGYQVRPVPSGALALAAAHAEPPDLILLDIRMPEMNGYQVCERLKADATTREVPIIFISALDAAEDKVNAFAVGGVDYVTKPFQNKEVLARVETHLTLQRLHTQLQEANQKMEHELALAGEVQTSFLPHRLPDIDGWQLSVVLEPARETSGDFYDVNPLPDGQVGILVADVVEKGVGAALFMALSWTLIRTYAAEYPAHPELVLGAVNRRILKDTHADQFVTVFYGVLDPIAGTLVYCNAGHPPPYLISAPSGENLQRLHRTGLPLGLFEAETWTQQVARFAPGDVLVLYTDGITEARGESEVFYGEDRLLESVRTNLGHSAQDIQNAVMADVHHFVGFAPHDQADDIALAVVVRDTA